MGDGFDWDAWGSNLAEKIGVTKKAYEDGKREVEPIGSGVIIESDGVAWGLVDNDSSGSFEWPIDVAEVSRSEVDGLEGAPKDIVKAIGLVKIRFPGATIKELDRSPK